MSGLTADMREGEYEYPGPVPVPVRRAAQAAVPSVLPLGHAFMQAVGSCMWSRLECL